MAGAQIFSADFVVDEKLGWMNQMDQSCRNKMPCVSMVIADLSKLEFYSGVIDIGHSIVTLSS